MYCKICKKQKKQKKKKKKKKKNMKSGIYLVFFLRQVAARKVSFSQNCYICYGIVQCVTDNGYVTDKEVEDSVRPVCQTYDFFHTLYHFAP